MLHSQLICPNERIVINVSGMYFETWSWTLGRFPNTLLGNPLKRKKYFDYIHNEYFFERHRHSFEAILHYYQSNGRFLNRPHNVPAEVFFDEIVFFELGSQAIDRYKKDEGFIIDKEANLRDLPHNRIQRAIWLLFEQPQSSIFSRIIAIISVIIIVISIALFCIETIPDIKNKRLLTPITTTVVPNYFSSAKSSSSGNHLSNTLYSTTPMPGSVKKLDELFIIETICTMWFTMELVMRFISAPLKLKFIKEPGNIIDLLSILPYYIELTSTSSKFAILRIIRLVRVFRVFKLARHFKGLQILAHTFQSSANELILLMFFLIIGVILFSSVVYFIEMDHPKSDFGSIPEGFWYAIITMTTVGYGDQLPKTVLGKFVGCFCAIAGVLTIALPVPIIVSHFQFFYQSTKMLKKVNRETLMASYQMDMDFEDETRLNDANRSRERAVSDRELNDNQISRFLKCFRK